MEDRLLMWRCKRGDTRALARIYEKYRSDLLRLAVSLLSERDDAEDAVHDVFISFARAAGRLRMNGSLKGYLATSVANAARNRARAGRRWASADLDEATPPCMTEPTEHWVILSEDLQRLTDAMARLPQEQREAVALHIYGEIRFREIAQLQRVSINTAQNRYRYGLNQLHALLEEEL